MKTLVSWSSGKDSALALHRLRERPDVEVVGLLTTINEQFDRVAMHGTRHALLEAQARAAGLPLHVVPIPFPCPNDVYEARMGAFVVGARASGIEAIAFGDLFLADIRAYREERLSGTGITPLFPVWQPDTRTLAREVIAAGIVAHTVCLDPRRMPRDLIGRRFDTALLADLPARVDPCGENGEFHTFVSAGPMFASPLTVRFGEAVERDGFVFIDVVGDG